MSGQKQNKEATLVDIKRLKIEGENFFCISNYDEMRPFFMSVVSDSHHWMFISSNGGLSAGRKNAEHALFPYYTADKITESYDTTGSKSIFQIIQNDETLSALFCELVSACNCECTLTCPVVTSVNYNLNKVFY
jgi:hypothetical protein